MRGRNAGKDGIRSAGSVEYGAGLGARIPPTHTCERGSCCGCAGRRPARRKGAEVCRAGAIVRETSHDESENDFSARRCFANTYGSPGRQAFRQAHRCPWTSATPCGSGSTLGEGGRRAALCPFLASPVLSAAGALCPARPTIEDASQHSLQIFVVWFSELGPMGRHFQEACFRDR